MVIGIDLRILPRDGKEGAGIAHASKALCNLLVRDREIQWRAYIPKGAEWEGCEKVVLSDVSGEAMRKALKKYACETLFVPGGAITPGLGVPAIPWVHDLMILDHPEWFPQGWIKRRMTTSVFLHGIKQAPLVFAVSQDTKQAIKRNTGMREDGIIVTGEGGDEWLERQSEEHVRIMRERAQVDCQKQWGIARPFILCLGTVEPRKNIAMLIRAWKRSMPRHQAALVIAGADGWKFKDVEEEMEQIPISLRRYYFRIRRLTDPQRLLLLASATAVAIPSLGEGFGLVALEAMQAGSPVIASTRGALPEVVGDGGVLLDPEDEDAWMMKLEVILQDADLRQVLSQKGITQSKKWSWDRSAQIVLEGLKKIR